MSEPTGTPARAIVLQINRPCPASRSRWRSMPRTGLATFLLTLTVMPDDEPPFRCQVTAELPIVDQWGVAVGAHVPVRSPSATTSRGHRGDRPTCTDAR